MNAYAVHIRGRADRSLTDTQMDMLTIYFRGTSVSVAHATETRLLLFTLRVDAASVPDAVTEAFRVTRRTARQAGFGYEAGELRVAGHDESLPAGLKLAAQGVPGGPDLAHHPQ